LRRRNVEALYKEQIEQLYTDTAATDTAQTS